MQQSFFYAKRRPIKENEEKITKEKLESRLGFCYINTVEPSTQFRPVEYNEFATIKTPFRSNEEQLCIIPENINEWLVIVFIDKTVGHGVFARQDIPKNTCICIYAGELSNDQCEDDYTLALITSLKEKPLDSFEKEEVSRGREILKALGRIIEGAGGSLVSENQWPHICFISSKQKGNVSRFFQHLPDTSSHSIIAKQNVRVVDVFDETLQLPVTLFISRHYIRKGEQIGFDYGKEYWKEANQQPKYFTMSGQIIDEMQLNKLVEYEQKIQRIKNNPITEEEEKLAKIVNRYQFSDYTTLSNLSCVNKRIHEEIDPLLTYVQAPLV